MSVLVGTSLFLEHATTEPYPPPHFSIARQEAQLDGSEIAGYDKHFLRQTDASTNISGRRHALCRNPPCQPIGSSRAHPFERRLSRVKMIEKNRDETRRKNRMTEVRWKADSGASKRICDGRLRRAQQTARRRDLIPHRVRSRHPIVQLPT